MPLNTEQLTARLKDRLCPVYLLAGEEPLLVQESADRLRAAARGQGYAEREVLQVSPDFNWGRLREAGANLSLFASQRLIELRMGSGKPGNDGSRALKAYAADPPPDTVLLVLAGSLDRTARSSAWFKALESAGLAVYAWPIQPGQLPGWLAQRLRAAGLSADKEAVEELAALTEGNLLAASQAVSRLALLYPGSRIAREQVRECVADNARFNVFDLTDKLLAGNTHAALRSLDRLREEGAAPPLVLWAIVRDLRTLALVCGRTSRGENMQQALAGANVWSRRKRPIAQAAQRLGEYRTLILLRGAAHADRVAKGAAYGLPWEELVELCAGITFGATGA